MNLKTIFRKLSLRFSAFFKALPNNGNYSARLGVEVAERFKIIIENPLVDVLTAIIPGSIDDLIIRQLRIYLPGIICGLTFVSDDNLVDLSKTVQKIRDSDSAIQNSFFHSLAVFVSREVAQVLKTELNWEDAIYLVEWIYQQRKTHLQK